MVFVPSDKGTEWMMRATDVVMGQLAESGGPQPASVTARSLSQQADRLLHMGEPLLAYNVLQQALEIDPHDVRVRQLKGLALARSGALRRANEILSSLRAEGNNDAETLGPLARTHKDLAIGTHEADARKRHLASAFELYDYAYREARRAGAVADAYYTGINAATMALLRGDSACAQRIAREVDTLCRRALDTGAAESDDYWIHATLAEVSLILGDLDGAAERYAFAASIAGTRYGDVSSTRHQARLLLGHLGIDPSWLDSAVPVPPILVFTGHMIDSSERSVPRFPNSFADRVRDKIRSRIAALKPAAAYGSAACGADILCLECVQELGGELHIVLPFPAEQFRAMSVDFCEEGDWGERFERLLESADEVLVVSERPPPSGVSTFEYANLVLTGLARLRAQVLDTRVHGLAVWDGTGAGDVGGTASVVDLWQRHGLALDHVYPCEPVDPGETQPGIVALAADSSDDREVPAFDYSVRAMLFADAVGYSRLSEDQIPLFFEHYLGVVAAYNRRTGYRPEHIETAGDGMYLVFAEPGIAAHYALELSDIINATDWQSRGLPANMSMRIGLHCGPVFIGRDPITGAPLYSGIHTSRTARIEPITPPGQVYASGAFAAVAAARGAQGLRFSYIGRTQLAKQYGALALYHVKRP